MHGGEFLSMWQKKKKNNLRLLWVNIGQNSVTKYQKRMKKVKEKASVFSEYMQVITNRKLVRHKDNFEKFEI